jgi:hypothetical protein
MCRLLLSGDSLGLVNQYLSSLNFVYPGPIYQSLNAGTTELYIRDITCNGVSVKKNMDLSGTRINPLEVDASLMLSGLSFSCEARYVAFF